MPAPTISIALPVYNGERYLGAAIESALAQTRGDFELVICDNASNDASDSIARRYAARDPRIRCFRNDKNIGAARNFCRAFELCGGRYFRWLAADDLMASAALERCAAVLDTQPDVVLATTAAEIIGEQGERLRLYDSLQQLSQATAIERLKAVQQQDPWCIAVYGLMRREVLQRTALLEPFSGSDVTLLSELSLHGRFAEVSQVLFSRRVHSGAYSSSTSEDNVRAFYAPEAKPGTALRTRTWLHRKANALAVWRAPVGGGERLRLFGHVARMCWWQRRDLVQELSYALRSQ